MCAVYPGVCEGWLQITQGSVDISDLIFCTGSIIHVQQQYSPIHAASDGSYNFSGRWFSYFSGRKKNNILLLGTGPLHFLAP
jgi:hypothetical protein